MDGTKFYFQSLRLNLELDAAKNNAAFWEKTAKGWQGEVLRRGHFRALYDAEYRFVRDFIIDLSSEDKTIKHVDVNVFMTKLNAFVSSEMIDPNRVLWVLKEFGYADKKLIDTVVAFTDIYNQRSNDQESQTQSESSLSYEDPKDAIIKGLIKEISSEGKGIQKLQKNCKKILKLLEDRKSHIQVKWSGVVAKDDPTQPSGGEAEFKIAK